eukprot:433162_1
MNPVEIKKGKANDINQSLIAEQKTKLQRVTNRLENTNDNFKKRKLNEFNSGINSNEPHVKKMKFNGKNKNDINDRLNALCESNKALKKENYALKQQVKRTDHYKDGVNIYKKEANKWKSKYIELYSHVMSNTVKMTNETAVNNTKDNMKLVASQQQISVSIGNKDRQVNINNNNTNSDNTNESKTILPSDTVQKIVINDETKDKMKLFMAQPEMIQISVKIDNKDRQVININKNNSKCNKSKRIVIADRNIAIDKDLRVNDIIEGIVVSPMRSRDGNGTIKYIWKKYEKIIEYNYNQKANWQRSIFLTEGDRVKLFFENTSLVYVSLLDPIYKQRLYGQCYYFHPENKYYLRMQWQSHSETSYYEKTYIELRSNHIVDKKVQIISDKLENELIVFDFRNNNKIATRCRW